jgi:hypothetical protein
VAQEGDRNDQVFAKLYECETQRGDMAKVRESCLESGQRVQHRVPVGAFDSDLLNKRSNGSGSSILALIDQQVKGRQTGIRCGGSILQSVSQQKAEPNKWYYFCALDPGLTTLEETPKEWLLPFEDLD